MRRAAGRCLAQVFAGGAQATSACSTSGRQSAEAAASWARRISSAGGAPLQESTARFDFYDSRRDVYSEFKDQWPGAPPRPPAPPAPRAPAAAAAREPPPPPAAAPALKGADWPPGYAELLGSFLVDTMGLSEAQAAGLVEAAREGLLPASRTLIRTRYQHIQDLEPRFPGFKARAAVLGEPRLLRHSATKLSRSMLVFQDHWLGQPVGPLMGRIGEYVVRDPRGLGHRLAALGRALQSDLGMPLEPAALRPDCDFLERSPYELEARVGAVATIFGREGGAALLGREVGVLRMEPQQLDAAVLVLREVFAADVDRSHRGYHVGTPEGAAAAAADRSYVTALAVAWPAVLELPGRYGRQAVERALRGVKASGGKLYRGPGWRGALLADVLARPELLAARPEVGGSGVEAAAAGDVESGVAGAEAGEVWRA